MIQPQPDNVVSKVRLSQLTHSEAVNARPSTKAANELVDSIRRLGLLQPLLVVPGDDPDAYTVVEGGRRLTALQAIGKEDGTDPWVPVLINLATDGYELARSIAANVDRVALHPFDQCTAITAMLSAGRTVTEAGERLGLTEKEVRGRLQLAKLAPQVVDAWRAGAIDAGAAEALSGHDHTRQRSLLKLANRWGATHSVISRSTIRGLLFHEGSMVQAQGGKAAFVGIDAYKAAGGTMTSDLFGDDVWLTDRPLLEKLADDKLRAWGESVVSEDGYGWAMTEAEAHARNPDWTELIRPASTAPFRHDRSYQGDASAQEVESARGWIQTIPLIDRQDCGVIVGFAGHGYPVMWFGFVLEDGKLAAYRDPDQPDGAPSPEPDFEEVGEQYSPQHSRPPMPEPEPEPEPAPEAAGKAKRGLTADAEGHCTALRAIALKGHLPARVGLRVLWLQLRAGHTPFRLKHGKWATETGKPLPAGAGSKFLANALQMDDAAVIDAIAAELRATLAIAPEQLSGETVDHDVINLMWDQLPADAVAETMRQSLNVDRYCAGLTKAALVDVIKEIGAPSFQPMPATVDQLRLRAAQDIRDTGWLPPQLRPVGWTLNARQVKD